MGSAAIEEGRKGRAEDSEKASRRRDPGTGGVLGQIYVWGHSGGTAQALTPVTEMYPGKWLERWTQTRWEWLLHTGRRVYLLKVMGILNWDVSVIR